MMNIPNFFQMQAIAAEEETRTITDPRFPDQPLTITLHTLDIPERHLVSDLVDELTATYIGDPLNGIAPKVKLGKVRDSKGRLVDIKLSNNLFWSVARILTQQVIQRGNQPVKADNLLYCSKVWETGWPALTSFSAEMEQRGKPKVEIQTGLVEDEDPGKDSGEGEAG